MATITLDTLTALANSVDGEPRANYSGRGMYGKTCVGIVIENETDLLWLGAEITNSILEADLAEKLLQYVRLDSMGTKSIVYFPQVQCEDAEDEDEDED